VAWECRPRPPRGAQIGLRGRSVSAPDFAIRTSRQDLSLNFRVTRGGPQIISVCRWNGDQDRASTRDEELAMRFALPTVVALTLLGCSGERAQPSPTAPGSARPDYSSSTRDSSSAPTPTPLDVRLGGRDSGGLGCVYSWCNSWNRARAGSRTECYADNEGLLLLGPWPWRHLWRTERGGGVDPSSLCFGLRCEGNSRGCTREA